MCSARFSQEQQGKGALLYKRMGMLVISFSYEGPRQELLKYILGY